jgi:hypothetical protein
MRQDAAFMKTWKFFFAIVLLTTSSGCSDAASDHGAHDGGSGGSGDAGSDSGLADSGDAGSSGSDAGDAGSGDAGLGDAGPDDVDSGDDGSSDEDAGGDGGEQPPVNAQPHLADTVTRVAGLLNDEVAFALAPVDPEGDTFAIYFKGCANSAGVIRLCKDSACAETLTLDCSVPHAENTEAVELDVDPSLKGYFQVGWIDPQDREGLNTAYFVFDDGVSEQPALDTAVIFDVRRINRAPILFVKDEDHETSEAQPAVGVNYNVAVSVFDQDFLESDFYVMTIKGTLDNSETPTATFDVAGMSATVVGDCDAIITETYFEFSCPYAAVQEFMRAISIVGPQVLAEGEGFVGLLVTANDNGYVGQCPEMPAYTSTPCPREDAVQVNVHYFEP